MKQTTLFVDTSIFRGAGFNFKSRTINILTEVAQRNSLKLLLPEIVEKEIIRKISSLSEELAVSLKASKKKAFMLERKKPWIFGIEEDVLEEEIKKSILEDWTAFQASFDIEKLPYSDIDLHRALKWWEVYEAPFSKKKSAEFADAFTATCLLNHQESNKKSIAVISTDNDWRNFCDKYKDFKYYDSALNFAESLNPDVESIILIKSIVEHSMKVSSRIEEVAINSPFNITLGWDSIIHSIKINSVFYKSLNVLDSSFERAKVAFNCDVGLRMELEYTDIIDGNRALSSPEKFETNYSSSIELSGIMTLIIDPDKKSVLKVKVSIDENCDFSFPHKSLWEYN